MRAWLAIGLGAAVLALPASARAGDPLFVLKLEAGSEYDSNVFRLDRQIGEDNDIEGSPLARLGARFNLGWQRVRGEQLSLRGFVGTKLFTTEEAQTENVVVGSGDGSYSWSFPDRSMVLSLRGSHYNAENYELLGDGRPVPGRTFAISNVESVLTLFGRQSHRVNIGVGYGWFDFKPDPDFDWNGVSALAGYQGTVWLGDRETNPEVASLDIGVSYRIDRRDYAGLAFRNQCMPSDELVPQCSIPTDLGRVDLAHLASAELAYTGERIYGLRYQLQLIDSNSFTQSFVRHRVDLGITTELLWDVFLTARGTILFNQFLDSLLITRDVISQSFVTIDDENRNSLALVFSRELSKKLTLEGRYLFFSNEFATQELDFRRQTAYLGFVYTAAD